LRRINGPASIVVIENGVDAAQFAGGESTMKNRILFVGSMDYHANIDGAIDFARSVWPLVHGHKPEFVFTIVGRNPTPVVRHLSSISAVEVTGSVKDVRPYYREAIVAVVPLNVGGGSRLKILEAMAVGVPVVSTVRGAEGLAVKHDDNIFLVDRLEQFADAVIQVADDERLRERLIAGGRKLVAERYDWTKVAAPVFNHYQELLSRAKQ
jgi:glycosyltransferase involved in cell wall biosynthesis